MVDLKGWLLSIVIGAGFLGFCLCLSIVVHPVVCADFEHQRNIMTVLFFNLLIAVALKIAASAVVAFILTNVVVG